MNAKTDEAERQGKWLVVLCHSLDGTDPPGSVVRWNDSTRVTTFISSISSNELRAAINAADITYPITVHIKALKPGIGTSQPVPFGVWYPK